MTRKPPPVLTEGTVAGLDRFLSRFLMDTCVIEREATGTDVGGAPVGAWTQVGDPEPCKVKAPGRMPVETISGGRAVPLVDYEISFSRAVDVQNKDRIVVNGRTLYVVADRDAVTIGLQTKVLVKTDQS